MMLRSAGFSFVSLRRLPHNDDIAAWFYTIGVSIGLDIPARLIALADGVIE
jgi:hypothetical protein